jgi:molecular chaperone HscB
MQAQKRQFAREESAGGADRPQSCWSCRGPVPGAAPFCPTCDAVQPPGQVDHFSRLGLAVGFDVDGDFLDRCYFGLQRRLHPDRFATRSSRERALSQQQATSLNEAYETLKDPLRRADYLMHLKGTEVLPEGCNLVNDPELLEEAMEMRESLDEAATAEDVTRVAERAQRDIEDCIARLHSAFTGERLEEACRLTTRLKYLRKLADEARARRAQLRP